MALITATALTSGASTGSSSFSTASVTPGANKLIFLVMSIADGASISSLAGNGLTWVLVNSSTEGNVTLYIYRSMAASPSAGAITATLGASVRHSWGVIELANINTLGTNGSSAVVQSAKANGTGTTLTATLAAFSNTANATFGASGITGNSGATAVSPGSGFTELSDTDGAGGGFHTVCETMFRNDNDTSVDSSTSSSMQYAIIGVEIANASTMPSSGGFFAFF